MAASLPHIISVRSSNGYGAVPYVISPYASADEIRRFESEVADRDKRVARWRVTDARMVTASVLLTVAGLAALLAFTAKLFDVVSSIFGAWGAAEDWRRFAPAVGLAVLAVLVAPHRRGACALVPDVEVSPQIACALRASSLWALRVTAVDFGSAAHRALWDYTVATSAIRTLEDAMKRWRRDGVRSDVWARGQRRLAALDLQARVAQERFKRETSDLAATAQAEALLARLAEDTRVA